MIGKKDNDLTPMNGQEEKDRIDPRKVVETASTEMIEGVEVGWLDKSKLKKLDVRNFLKVQQTQWNHALDLFNKAWLIRKDLELNQIALAAAEAVALMKQKHTELMKNVVLDEKDDVLGLMIRFGEMVTKRIDQAQSAEIDDEIRDRILKDIRSLWNETQERIHGGLDDYVKKLEKKDRLRENREDS